MHFTLVQSSLCYNPHLWCQKSQETFALGLNPSPWDCQEQPQIKWTRSFWNRSVSQSTRDLQLSITKFHVLSWHHNDPFSALTFQGQQAGVTCVQELCLWIMPFPSSCSSHLTKTKCLAMHNIAPWSTCMKSLHTGSLINDNLIFTFGENPNKVSEFSPQCEGYV